MDRPRHRGPLENGLALVPLAGPLAALTPFTGRLVNVAGFRWPAGVGLLATGCGYLGLALVGESEVDGAAGWALLTGTGTGMGIAVRGLVADATEALGPDRAGIAAAVNNTSRQVGGAIGVALIGGLGDFSAALAASGAALLLGGAAALALMGRTAKRIPRPARPRPGRCPAARPRSRASAGDPG